MRLVNRSTVLFLGSIASAGLLACGDDGGSGGGVDPSGTDNTYVVSQVAIPETPAQATALGLDIDGISNDGIDNNLGTLLASIGSVASGLDLQGSLDESVDTGSIILLTNVKAKALDNASRVGMWVYVGANPTPPACDGAGDTTCRKHLTGSATFEIDDSAGTDGFLAGNIMAGKFTGGPGTVTLQIALSGAPIELPLQLARAEINVSANGIASGSKIGGAIAKSDLDSKVYPAIHTTVNDLLVRDCGPTPRTGADCGCGSGSTGSSILGFLDNDNNCDVTVAEVSATIDSLLTLDIDLDGNDQNDAVSLGVGVTAVKGAFTVPPM